MSNETYVTLDHCHDTTRAILDNQKNMSTQLGVLESVTGQQTDEMTKLREVIRGNNHIEGSLLWDVKVTKDKLDEHLKEVKNCEVQKTKVSENKKDRDSKMSIVIVGVVASVIMELIQMIFG